MFAKPYKLKSNNTLKNSEKKHLVQRILQSFSAATEERVKELIPNKSTVILMKLVVHSGDVAGVYSVDNVPMMLEVEERMVPTVCALWKVPELVPTLTIHSPVLQKMQGGAPLYVPGVVRASAAEAGQWIRGSILAARTEDNAAAALVGRATISSADMFFATGGVCLEALQVIGDLLCKDEKFNKIERPKLQPDSVDAVTQLNAQLKQLKMEPPRESWPALRSHRAPVPLQPPVTPPPVNQPAVIADDTSDTAPAPAHADNFDDTLETDDVQGEESAPQSSIPADMDGLLRWCLLSFIKLDGKNITLPLKTNLLYRNHLIPLCPNDRSLDVKKSSYKKMSKFLQAMQEEGLIEVREIEKGVDAITAVNVQHPALRGHRAPSRPAGGLAAGGPAAAEGAPGEEEYVAPQVREMFAVTAAVMELFAPCKKGTALTGSDVRAGVVQYVRTRNLTSENNKNIIVLDKTLAAIVRKQEQECVKYEELMSGIQDKMTSCTEMRFADGTVQLTKTKLEPIKMQTVTRSGNKKVTLVSNLESFGFRLAPLARWCQQRAAAAAGVTRTPGSNKDQLQLQGDQTYFMAKLLIEKYGLPKKFVDGADKALKKKNK